MKKCVAALVMAAAVLFAALPVTGAYAAGTVHETALTETGYGELNNLVSNKQLLDGQLKSVSESGTVVSVSDGYERYPILVDGGDRDAHLIDRGGEMLERDDFMTVRYGFIGNYYPGRISSKDQAEPVGIGAEVTISNPVNLVRMALFDNFWYGGMIDAAGGKPGGRADYSITFFRTDTGAEVLLGEDAWLVASSLDGWPFEPKISYEGISFSDAPETFVTYRSDGNIVRGGEELFGIESYYTAERKAAYEDVMEDKLFINCGVAFRQNSTTWQCTFVTQTDHPDGHSDWFYFTASPFNLVRPEKPQKTAEEAVYHVGDEVTYRISERVADTPDDGYGSYASFQFIDRLPEGLDYVSSSIECSSGDMPDSAGSVSFDELSRTVIYNFSPDYLKEISYEGQTYTFVVVCRINAAALGGQTFANTAEVVINGESVLTPSSEITPYYRITTEAVNGTIDPPVSGICAGETKTVSYRPDPGCWLSSLSVDGEEQDVNAFADSFTWTDIRSNHHIRAVFEQIPENRQITLTKRIRSGDVVFDHGNPVFFFKAEGTDIRGNKRICYRAAVFTDKMEADESGYLSGTVCFSGLMPGTYTVTEEETNRYAPESVADVTGGSKTEEGIWFNLIENESGSAVFINQKYEQGGFSDAAFVENHIIG